MRWRRRTLLGMVFGVVVGTAAMGCPARDGSESGDVPGETPAADEATRPTTRRVMRAEVDPCPITDPCPDVTAEVQALLPGDPRIDTAYVVDARAPAEFAAWHLPGAVNVAYDFLEPTPDDAVAAMAAASAPRVVVYGDGDDPDTGHELARDLAVRGIPDVYYVVGGAAALAEDPSLSGSD